MASLRDHLKKVHTREAEHHVAAAKLHKQLAKCFGKADGMEESTGDLAAAHEGLAQQHLDLGEFHLECCKDIGKAMMDGGDDLNRIVPDGVSAVYKRDNTAVRAVTRVGQPSMAERANVPDEFQKLVSVEDNE